MKPPPPSAQGRRGASDVELRPLLLTGSSEHLGRVDT